MLKVLQNSFLFCMPCLLVGCIGVNQTSKYQLSDGVYKLKSPGISSSHIYLEVMEDSMVITPLQKGVNNIDKLSFPNSPSTLRELSARHSFIKNTVDFNVLTILFKYRPGTSGFPKQLNTNLNGALYLGHRSDKYSLSYQKNKINTYNRKLEHLGYSFGFFAGLGSTAMNPWVTNNSISSEYDGVVFPKGVAGIIGVNNISVGINIGIDHLLDTNNKTWIYQGKPWIGLSVGLNLN